MTRILNEHIFKTVIGASIYIIDSQWEDTFQVLRGKAIRNIENYHAFFAQNQIVPNRQGLNQGGLA
jgi:hypothetical protein